VSALIDAIVALDTRVMLLACLLVLDAWAITLIIKARPSLKEGLLWSAIVLLCPIIGCLFWYALGPKPLRRASDSSG
jgi:Na+/proline symporter